MKVVLCLVAVFATAILFNNCSPKETAQTTCPSSNVGYAVDNANNLLCFSLSSPGTIDRSIPLTDLAAGDTIVAIDFRPQSSNLLWALSSTGQLYMINLETGYSGAFGSPITFPGATKFGMEFDPTTGDLHIITDNDLNYSITIHAGALTVGTPLSRSGGGDPTAIAHAYTNNTAGVSSTTTRAIDSAFDVLLSLNPATGVVSTMGSLGFDATDNSSFDIRTVSGTDTGYAALTTAVNTVTYLHTINLTTGTATLVDAIGGGRPIVGFAVAP
jgi:hypothetical protein